MNRRAALLLGAAVAILGASPARADDGGCYTGYGSEISIDPPTESTSVSGPVTVGFGLWSLPDPGLVDRLVAGLRVIGPDGRRVQVAAIPTAGGIRLYGLDTPGWYAISLEAAPPAGPSHLGHLPAGHHLPLWSNDHSLHDLPSGFYADLRVGESDARVRQVTHRGQEVGVDLSEPLTFTPAQGGAPLFRFFRADGSEISCWREAHDPPPVRHVVYACVTNAVAYVERTARATTAAGRPLSFPPLGVKWRIDGYRPPDGQSWADWQPGIRGDGHANAASAITPSFLQCDDVPPGYGCDGAPGPVGLLAIALALAPFVRRRRAR